MKIFLLKSGLTPSQFPDYLTTDGILGDDIRASMQNGIVDYDLFITDLNLVKGDVIRKIYTNKHHIGNRVMGGGVLLCFAGDIATLPTNLNNYQWLSEQFGLHIVPEALSGEDFEFYGTLPFIKDFKKWEAAMNYNIIFNNKPSSDSQDIAKNKGDKIISFYQKFGNGHIFILPRPKNIEQFSQFFINTILPQLNIDFEIVPGSIEPIPEQIKSLNVFGQTNLNEEIARQRSKIEEENGKLEKLEVGYRELDEWKDLLWQTGLPLENIVKRFFGLLGLELENKDKSATDLVGEYDKKEIFIEVKGKEGGINHKEDYRQIADRKFYDSIDPENTIALLVGNPYRLQPLENRPPKDKDLFAQHSTKAAPGQKIGLIPTVELFNIVNDFLENKIENKKDILEAILNCHGLYQKTKI